MKGLGPKIYDFCQVENRLMGRSIDQAMAGILAIAPMAEESQELQLIPRGPVTWLPPGSQVQQARLADNLQSQLIVKRDIQSTLQSNTGMYRQRIAEDNQEPTLGQAQMNLQQQTVLGGGAVNRYYRSLDRLYYEMVRRILNPKLSTSDAGGKEVDEFKEYCVKRGVPEQALTFENICKVKATRSIGWGSPAMRDMISNKLVSFMPMMDERSRRNAQRTAIAPYVGQHQVDSFFPPYDDANVPDDQEWVASMENPLLRGEFNPQMCAELITPSQNNIVHFDNHMSDANTDITALQQQQADPMKVLNHLHNAGAHCMIHLQKMSGDPTRKDQLAQRQQQLAAMSKVADQLQQQITEHLQSQQQQQQQPQLDGDAIAAMQKVKLDAQIKQQKMQGDLQLKSEKQKAMLQLKDLETAHKIRTANAQTANTIQTANATTVNTLRNNNVKTAAAAMPKPANV